MSMEFTTTYSTALTGGFLFTLIATRNSCLARNQMWQLGKSRRDKFVEKANSAIRKRMEKIAIRNGYCSWKIEHAGSTNLYDVADKRNQKFLIVFTKQEVDCE